MREPLTDWNKEWAACADEAAEKARNELLPAWFNLFLTNVCELPDRNSPDDEPEAIFATLEELRNCAISAIEQCAPYAYRSRRCGSAECPANAAG